MNRTSFIAAEFHGFLRKSWDVIGLPENCSDVFMENWGMHYGYQRGCASPLRNSGGQDSSQEASAFSIKQIARKLGVVPFLNRNLTSLANGLTWSC